MKADVGEQQRITIAPLRCGETRSGLEGSLKFAQWKVSLEQRSSFCIFTIHIMILPLAFIVMLADFSLHGPSDPGGMSTSLQLL